MAENQVFVHKFLLVPPHMVPPSWGESQSKTKTQEVASSSSSSSKRYLERLLVVIENTTMPWVAWTNGWYHFDNHMWSQWYDRLSTAPPEVVCIALAPENPQTNQGLPVLWRTRWLQALVRGTLPPVPSLRLLTFALFYQLRPEQRVILRDVSTPVKWTSHRYPRHPLQEQNLVAHALPILSCEGKATPAAPTGSREVPVTSVLISTYNAGERLFWAIQSVLCQTFSNWELIVVDDGSTDDTQERLQAWIDRSSGMHHSIRVITLPANRGKAHALNEALKAVSGTYIFELDADDWLAPAALEVFTTEMDRSPSSVSILSGGYHLWLEDAHGELFYKQPMAPQSFAWNEESATPPIPRFYRAAALRKVGGWPENDPSSGRLFEDVAVCSKVLGAQSDALKLISQVLYHRVLRQDSVSQRNRTIYPEWARKWHKQLTESHAHSQYCESER